MSLQQAQHENILKMFGWTKWEDGIAIITEYMPGGNLWDLLSNPAITSIPFLLQLRLCSDISNGIAHIHDLYPRARLVHGDIKPENILLTKDLRCKIADFGGSKLVAETTSAMSLVKGLQSRNKVHITRIYAPPEALRFCLLKPKHTHDIFSFSIVIYEIVTRTKPNEHCSNRDQYEEAIKSGQRPDVSSIELTKSKLISAGNEIDASIITTLHEMMTNCWSQNPSDRPEMADVHRKLQKLLSQFSLEDQNEAAQNAISKTEMKHPSFQEHNTVAVDKLSLPNSHQGI